MDNERIIKMIGARHPGASAKEWLKGLSAAEVNDFLEAKNRLPQKIDDETAMAWYYDFDQGTAGWKEDAKKDQLAFELAKISKLSPFETAIVAERLSGGGRFFQKSAETIVKEKKMLVPPKAPGQAKTNHLALAKSYMAEAAKTEAYRLPYKETLEIVRKDKYDGDGPIGSSGSRYLFLEADGRAIPVIRVVGKDVEWDDYKMELGAMAAQADDFAGGVIVALNPDTLYAEAKSFTKAELEPFRDQALEYATEFMERHVVKGAVIPLPKREAKAQLDEGQKEMFQNLAADAALWAEVEKGAKEKGDEARSRMKAYAESCASQMNVPLSGLGLPKDLFTARVKLAVDEDELAGILETNGAREKVMTMKGDSKKMEKALKAHKIPESEWANEAVDMKALVRFCQDNGMDAAIVEEVTFASNPKGNQEMREGIAEKAGGYLKPKGMKP